MIKRILTLFFEVSNRISIFGAPLEIVSSRECPTAGTGKDNNPDRRSVSNGFERIRHRLNKRQILRIHRLRAIQSNGRKMPVDIEFKYFVHCGIPGDLQGKYEFGGPCGDRTHDLRIKSVRTSVSRGLYRCQYDQPQTESSITRCPTVWRRFWLVGVGIGVSYMPVVQTCRRH